MIEESLRGRYVSIDSKLRDDDDDESTSNYTLESTIPDENAVVPNESAAFALLGNKIKKVLRTLTTREQRIILSRFGFLGIPCSLIEIGMMEGVSRNRIHQIEAKALRKLRHPTRARLLEGYIELP